MQPTESLQRITQTRPALPRADIASAMREFQRRMKQPIVPNLERNHQFGLQMDIPSKTTRETLEHRMRAIQLDADKLREYPMAASGY